MSADLFPGFDTQTLETSAGALFARSAGAGAPLLLLHGFPQSGVMWHRMAPALAARRRVILVDLPGYGQSEAPEPGRDHAPYSKRAMAAALVDLMGQLGHSHFSVLGHDRGARVGYRMALDHPGRVDRLALLDIVPTLTMWHGMDRARALQVYHWAFLAQPHPFPETVIGRDPHYFLDWTLASWTAAKDLSAFAPEALAHYHAAFSQPERIRAACEDYRAGATIDLAHDEADRAEGRAIQCPVRVLWGDHGIPSRGASPLEAWKIYAPQVEGQPITGGHFLPEEAPEAVLAALADFL